MDFGLIGGVVGGGLGMVSTYQANQQADQSAKDANKANVLAASRSRDLTRKNAETRKADLLRKFNINVDKTQDTNQQLNMETVATLTDFTISLAATESKTDNALASKHITGRLAERFRSTTALQGALKKGSILTDAEQKHRAVGESVEIMQLNLESEQTNMDIDTANAINAANNQEIMGYTYSQSSGTLGVISSGVSGGASGYSAGRAF